MKRTWILIAACLAVMLFSGGISQADVLPCCLDGYAQAPIYQWKNGACMKDDETYSCDREDECTPPDCSYGAAMACIQSGNIWKESPYCQCHTGCDSSIVQICYGQGRDTDPDNCQCTGTCSMSLVSTCLATGGSIDEENCKCYYSDPCAYPVAYIAYGFSGFQCVSCGNSCVISTGDILVIDYFGTDNTYCLTKVTFNLEPGAEVCFETSSCFPLCGLFGC